MKNWCKLILAAWKRLVRRANRSHEPSTKSTEKVLLTSSCPLQDERGQEVMARKNDTPAVVSPGSFAYENWRAALAGQEERSVFEHPLFSDAHFSISMEMKTKYGPYLLFNTQSRGVLLAVPSLILQTSYHIDSGMPNLNATDVERYHGGGIQDEVAALISLCLGVRLKAGGMTRFFLPEKDAKGQPMAPYEGNPILEKRQSLGPILPYALGERDLSQAKLMKEFADLGPLDSIELVRAARLYQDALWIAETEPQLSWLMLVSSVETAANHWRSSKETAIERVRTSKPDLAQLLMEVGGEEHLVQVAELIADYMGATRKFLDFLMAFLPDAPAQRPLEHDQHLWNPSALKKSLSKIYDYRSKALHGGIPIPFPMCKEAVASGDGWAEVMVGYAAGAYGGVWRSKDAPMMLHLFEYLVRSTLLNWWRSMTPSIQMSLQEMTTE